MMHVLCQHFDTNTVSLLDDVFRLTHTSSRFSGPPSTDMIRENREKPWENSHQVLLIVAATVQLRMYSSHLFSRYADVFVEEPED